MKKEELLEKISQNRQVFLIYSGKSLPTIRLEGPGGTCAISINLQIFGKKLKKLAIGEVFTIGRGQNCDFVLPDYYKFETVNCFISKESSTVYFIYDCSRYEIVVK